MVSRLGLTRNQLATVSKDAEVIKQLEKLFATINDLVDGGVPAGAAEALATTGADVDVGLSGPPTIGQVLTATSATTATWQAAGGGGAPTTAQYVTLATDATLTNERVLTAGAGISIVDGGAGLPVTVSTTGPQFVGNPGTTVAVVGDVAGDVTNLSNLTHNSTTKTTSTSTLAAAIDVQTALLTLDEALLPATIANKMSVFVDTSNRLKVVRETGTVVQLDAVEVGVAGALTGTRRRINFVSGATAADNAGTDAVDVTVTGGSGGGTFGQATATFSGGADSVVVTVADVAVTAGSNIIPTVGTAAGRDADEMEMAPVVVAVGTITAGVGFDLIVVSLDGDADGAYLINYTRD